MPTVGEAGLTRASPIALWHVSAHQRVAGSGVWLLTISGMMDQMASVGVEFDRASLDRVFKQTSDYYHTLRQQEETQGKFTISKKKTLPWAVTPIFENNHPHRPWGLGAICKRTSLIFWMAGTMTRTPGMYKQTDPKTQKQRSMFLQDTNERIHSSVRVRLACKGLGLNDTGVWNCPALDKWRLRFTADQYEDPVPLHPQWESEGDEPVFIKHPSESSKGRWVWEYVGDEREAHPDRTQRVMVEEPLGPYERYLLQLSGGTPNVYDFAAGREVL